MSGDLVWLGMDGGGTKLVAAAADPSMRLLHRFEAGPANLSGLSDSALEGRLREIRETMPRPTAIGVGLAGMRTPSDQLRLSAAVERIWPGIPAEITHDLEIAWLAADPAMDPTASLAVSPMEHRFRVLVLSGTGACCYGRKPDGDAVKVGGWGHRLGDRGSAYALVELGLRQLITTLDRTGKWGFLGARILRRLVLNSPDDLISWMKSATPTDVAALAPEIFSAATDGDTDAISALEIGREQLVGDALACARRLTPGDSGLDFVMAGSVLLHQPKFASTVGMALLDSIPGSRFRTLGREPVWGAVELARKRGAEGPSRSEFDAVVSPRAAVVAIPTARRPSPTEQVDPRFALLDRISIRAGLALLLAEEARVAEVVAAQDSQIEELVRRTVRSFRAGGRLFYVGAGTSGRLGVLDASECPPTFGTPPDRIQGIIAGGVTALHTAVEGAEDDWRQGAEAVAGRQVGPHDVVVGIAASGRTPFVWGALGEARVRGAQTALICCRPGLRFARGTRPQVVITLDTGPEVVAGSTRLKAGTATKVVLNALTTLVMVQCGKVAGNLMVDLDPTNLKLRQRAVEVVARLAKVRHPMAREVLIACGWNVAEAAIRLGWKRQKKIAIK